MEHERCPGGQENHTVLLTSICPTISEDNGQRVPQSSYYQRASKWKLYDRLHELVRRTDITLNGQLVS